MLGGGLAGLTLARHLLLATDKRVLMVPAMNVRMWEHAATRRNVAQLEASLAAVDVEMTPEWWAEISALSYTPAPATDRSEIQKR